MISGFAYQVSCIVPIYNVEQYLKDCVDSLLQITEITVEIILVDDGSTDSSFEIAKQYADQYPYVKVIHQPNKGLSEARNRGLEVAKGEYIAFIDSDDWIDANGLVRLYKQAQRNQADLILGNIVYVYPDGTRQSPYLPLMESLTDCVLSGRCCFMESYRQGKLVPMATSYLYRRCWLERYPLRFEPILHEDELWTVKAMCLAERVVCTEWSFYYYRQRPGSIMNTLNTGKRLNSLIYIANHLLKFADWLGRDSDGDLWNLLYLKAARFYKQAFWLLDKMRDSRFRLASHSLYQLYRLRNRLYPEVRPNVLSCYRFARKKLRLFHAWRVSPEVRHIPAVIPTDKQLVLFYNRMWEMPLAFPREQIPENILITSDQKYWERADVVVFHLPTLEFDLEDDLEKRPGQRWVAWTMECEENYPFIKSTEFMSLFDYWMSYHQGADVVQPYYAADYPERMRQVTPEPFETKRDVCMMVSSHVNQSGRQEYLKALMQEFPIDSYGKLYNNCRLEKDKGQASKMELYGHYKFVIAFENACAEDYVTEKFFDPLLVGAVPVYWGAPNIGDYAPGDNCFVDVREFRSPHDLALHLKACCENPSLYAHYQQWRHEPLRPSFIKKAAEQRIHPYIRLCELIQKTPSWVQPQKKLSGRLVFCSFGDSRYQASRKRLQEQAEDFDCFDAIYLYDETDLSDSFRRDFQAVLKPGVRGFGYWVWKPRIILDTLAKMEEGDVLLYVDMGCGLNSRGREKLFAYCQEVRQNESGFLVSQLEPDRKECFWTKGDVLDYFRIRGQEEMYTPQYQSGVVFIRKEAKTVALVQQWLDVFYENFHLADDTSSLSANEPGFVEHRHDQSILLLLLKQHGTSVIPLEEVYRPNWNLKARFYPIRIERDLR